MVASYKILNSKKYLWDGRVYTTESDAKSAEKTYKNDNFETQVLSENNQYFVYTRRDVKK